MSKKKFNLVTRQGVRNLDVILGKRPSKGLKVDLGDFPEFQRCEHPDESLITRKEGNKTYTICTLCKAKFGE